MYQDSCTPRRVNLSCEATYLIVNAVTRIPPHYPIPLGLCYTLNLVSNLPVRHARFADLDRLLHALLCGGNQVGRLGVNFADRVGTVQVTVHAAVEEGDVEVDNVAFLERALVGNALAGQYCYKTSYTGRYW